MTQCDIDGYGFAVWISEGYNSIDSIDLEIPYL